MIGENKKFGKNTFRLRPWIEEDSCMVAVWECVACRKRIRVIDKIDDKLYDHTCSD